MTTAMIETRVHWRLHSVCPPDWSSLIDRHGAGFFHSPAGLAAAGEKGDSFFGELLDGDDVVGIVAGVHRRCRVLPRPRHAYLPAPPAIAAGSAVTVALAAEALRECAGDEGWTELTVGSLEAAGEVAVEEPGKAFPPRTEYDIRLSGTPEELVMRLNRHHRRHLSEGAPWTLRTLSGRDARDVVIQVTSSVRQRAATHGGVTYDEVVVPSVGAFREDPAWGLTTYAAMLGDVPFSAALVGWAGKRAYYVSGGSTPEGYARNASVWLHFQIALAFQAAGFTHYCLGGAPASARDPQDPSHGLHRFKIGFGSQVRFCAGARWVFSAAHDAGHRLPRWIRERFLARGKEAASI
jgi:hypothetical protein